MDDDYPGIKRVRAATIAKANGCSANHILDLYREGTIPGWKFGKLVLFDPHEVDVALENYRSKGRKVVK